MDTVVAGSRLLVTANKASNTLPTLQLLSDNGEGGTFTRSMVRYDLVNYVDSLSYQTPSSNPVFTTKYSFRCSPVSRS